MSFTSLFSTLRVSPSSLSSISRSFSTSLSARALEATVYVSQLTKSETADELRSRIESAGLEVVGSRILASKASKAGAGLVKVMAQDEVLLSDVLEAVRSLNIKSKGEQGVFKAFLASDSPAAGLAHPSPDTVEMLNLPDSISTIDQIRTLIHYTAYSEAWNVKLAPSPEDAEGNVLNSDFLPGMCVVKPTELRFRDKLLTFSGQVVEENEIVVLPHLAVEEDQYRIWSQAAEAEEVVEEEETSEEQEQPRTTV